MKGMYVGRPKKQTSVKFQVSRSLGDEGGGCQPLKIDKCARDVSDQPIKGEKGNGEPSPSPRALATVTYSRGKAMAHAHDLFGYPYLEHPGVKVKRGSRRKVTSDGKHTL